MAASAEQLESTPVRRSEAVLSSSAGAHSAGAFPDNRPVALAQRQQQALINNSSRLQPGAVMQAHLNHRPVAQETQLRAVAAPQPGPARRNTTSLPDHLKTGIENLSGYSLDDVRVHYNSDKPAQLQAHAYAQGTAIHVAPGQEQHLPHEAWHVVQQKQGRVRATRQLKGIGVNDNAGLEKEADVMGARALAGTPARTPAASSQPSLPGGPGAAPRQFRLMASAAPAARVVQRLLIPLKTPAVPTANENNIIADANAIEVLTATAYTNTWNRLSAATAPVGAVPLDITQFPGASVGHFSHMINSLQRGDDALKAAAVGYIIEDQVTNGGIPGTVTSQVGVGGAIPDFVSTHGGVRGIIDITSSGQQGHVMDKAFTKTLFPYIAESTYQSINFGALNGGAAPVLTGAAATLAQQAMQRRASNHIGGRLYQLLRNLELFAAGIKWNDRPYTQAMTDLKGAINALPRAAVWDNGQVANVDQLTAALNAQLDPIYHQQTLTQLITETQANYLVAGNPMWP